jgi:hypothetical protein
MEDLTSETFLGIGHPIMASIFYGSTTIPSFVGTGADPGFNASTMHQQNPNYQALSATPAKQMKSHPR